MSKLNFNEINPTGPRTPVSKSDRAKIDAFIKAQGVTVCPPCTFSRDWAENYSWREMQDREASAKFRAKVSKEKRAARAQAEGAE